MTDAGGLHVRPIAPDEWDEFLRVEAAGFGNAFDEELAAADREVQPIDRTVAAFVDGALVGTAGSFAFDLSTPGGEVQASGITAVAVLPTHRRRGVLRAMMRHLLDDLASRGDPVAILNASESSIYERFGFGAANDFQVLELDREALRWAVPPPARAFRMLTKEQALVELPPIYEAYRCTRPGPVTRDRVWWEAILGPKRNWRGGGDVFVVIAEPTDDDPGGFVLYDRPHPGPGVSRRLEVRELVAATDETAAALWDFCANVDLVDTAQVMPVALDDPVRWRLADPRRLRVVRQAEYLWVRFLDVGAGLEARRYGVDGEIVIELTDAFRPQTAGTYRLAAEDGIASCARTDAAPDLVMSVADLGSLYLGGVRASTLARAGRIEERRAGSLAVADALFAADRLPICSTYF